MKEEQIPKGTVVHVIWIDSQTLEGWRHNPEDIQTVYKIQTLGYVFGHTETMLSISASMSETGAVLDPVKIPWCSIQSIEYLDKRYNMKVGPIVRSGSGDQLSLQWGSPD